MRQAVSLWLFVFMFFTFIPILFNCAASEEDKSKPSPEPPDRSLTVQEYVDRGLPDVKDYWTEGRMDSLVSGLSHLAADDLELLPRLRSARSGDVFKMIVSEENLSKLTDPATPIAKRVPGASHRLSLTNQIVVLYNKAFKKNKSFASEMVELAGAELRIITIALKLTDQWLPTLDKDNPADAAKIAAIQKLKPMAKDFLIAAIRTIADADDRTLDLRIKLAGDVKTNGPEIIATASKDEQLEILLVTSMLDRQENAPKIRELLSEIHHQMSASAKKLPSSDEIIRELNK
jgi:hypothetical protein